MASLKRCDQCRKEAGEYDLVWLHMENESPIQRIEYARAADFCSWACMADYATVQRDRWEQPQPRSPRPLDASAP